MYARRLLNAPHCNDLWDKYYMVRMPYLQSRPVEQIRRFGIRISENELLDRQRETEMILTQLNIDMMFEHWRKGVTIRVINYNDTAEIYKIIHQHLIAWAEYLSGGINTGAAPLKDLIELDEFASVVYDKAVNVFSQEQRRSAIAENFVNVQSINFFNILQRERRPEETHFQSLGNGIEAARVDSSDSKPKLPTRNSLKDLFSEQVNAINGWRSHGE